MTTPYGVKGFTLIELLVVIAIVAVLAVTVILTLNPAQLLRQARDSNRVQDLASLKSAMSLYLADVATPSIGVTANCYAHASSSLASCTAARFAGGTTVVTTSSLNITGTGWIPVNLTLISSGAPLSALPIDPVNNTTYFYAYRADATAVAFEINAEMESAKFMQSGTGDVESKDGGNNPGLYEVGTDPGLDL